jgi:hypothetical protein
LAAGLNNNFPTYLTGIGLETIMTLGPSSVDWSGTQIQETAGMTSNTCPPSVSACSATNGFQVGVNQGGLTSFGYSIPTLPSSSSFYDEHVIVSTTDLLAAGPNSCQIVCAQTYTCAGASIGSFTVTKTLTHSSIGSTPVTQVTITKQ